MAHFMLFSPIHLTYVYSISANLRTTPSLQQLFSQGGAESQRGDHGLRRYFLFCQFYIFNSYVPNFLELIYSSQLRKIRIPIVSDAECDRCSGLHLKVTTYIWTCVLFCCIFQWIPSNHTCTRNVFHYNFPAVQNIFTLSDSQVKQFFFIKTI